MHHLLALAGDLTSEANGGRDKVIPVHSRAQIEISMQYNTTTQCNAALHQLLPLWSAFPRKDDRIRRAQGAMEMHNASVAYSRWHQVDKDRVACTAGGHSTTFLILCCAHFVYSENLFQ